MKKIHLILFMLITNSIICQEIEECVFDRTTQTDEFIIKKGKFTEYKWDNENKTATIKLENGETLKAFRGGCVHFGMSGEIFTEFDSSKINDLDFWLNKALWISKNLFDNKDYEYLKDKLTKKDYHQERDENSIYIFIPHEIYDEFSISVRMEDEKAVLYVGYYFS
jgi:hypothetical protein